MKNLGLLLACTFVLGVTSHAQQVSKTVEWTVTESAEGRFKAAFPSAPERSTHEVEGTQGNNFVVEFYSVLPYAAFMITYADFPKSGPTNEAGLRAYYDKFRAAMIERTGAKLISERDVVVSEKLGREIEMVQGDQIVDYRVYNVGLRLYQTVTSFSSNTPAEFGAKQAAIRFLDSFELIEQNNNSKL